jgi:hypothetical protein
MFFPIPFPNKNRNYILNVVHFEVILIVIENTSNFLIDAVLYLKCLQFSFDNV